MTEEIGTEKKKLNIVFLSGNKFAINANDCNRRFAPINSPSVLVKPFKPVKLHRVLINFLNLSRSRA